ncbi:MAG TPA: Gfo/Idh/MocA family oxidoreductase [Planctomycetota bacterium]|nr:Gfo/Idh/MocA family oxidoreductase [Planctomycetota bacterium]
MPNEKRKKTSRRRFIRGVVTGTLAAGSLGALPIPGIAQERRTLKSALVGCGGRGTGAIANHVEAAQYCGVDVKVVGLCDLFGEKAAGLSRKFQVPENRTFLGFEGYKQLLETDVEVVLLATPPCFRPLHFEAAIKAGKHVFFEKPVGVDPPGCRKVIEVSKLAREKQLCVVAGTQRRHSRGYRETKKALDEGAIGKIRGGSVYWCGTVPWENPRDPAWSDAEYLCRNWVNFTEMSGDHIVEQHVHNIDIMHWYMGGPPVSALGFGLRARRQTGNQYDFFSIDYEYPEGVHIHSMCRQMAGTDGGVYEHLVGEKGIARSLKPKDTQVFPQGCPEYPNESQRDYVQEHIGLLHGITKGAYINEGEQVAISTAIAVMGRISAYTGKKIEWKHMMDPDPNVHKAGVYDLTLRPSALDFETGFVRAPEEEDIALPGSGEGARRGRRERRPDARAKEG